MNKKIYNDLFELIRIRSSLEILAAKFHQKPYGMYGFFVRMAINRINLVVLDLENEQSRVFYDNPAYKLFTKNYDEIMREIDKADFKNISSQDKHKLIVQHDKLRDFYDEHEKCFTRKQRNMLLQAQLILIGAIEK